MKTANRRRSSTFQVRPSPETPALSPWRIEFEQSLHRVCTGLKRGVEQGKPLRRLIARAAKRWDKKPFRFDPSRKFQLSRATLNRLFNQWRRGGGVPSALRHRYHPAGPSVPAPVLVRFVAFVAGRPWPSLKAAWKEFASHPGAYYARGRKPAARRLPFTYGQVNRYFSGANFRALQTQLAARTRAEQELARLRVEITAGIRRRVPDHPQRKRRAGSELSLLSAQL